MNNTKIKIEYGQIKFEVESDAENAAKERNKFLETLPLLFSMYTPIKDLKSENVGAENTFGVNEDIKLISNDNKNEKYQNINTFLNDKGFETNNDKVLGVAFYLQEIENANAIDSNSIKERMKKAKLVIPNNISLAINQLTKKGFLQPSDSDDSTLSAYYVTSEGISYVEKYIKSENLANKKTITSKRNVTITQSKYSDLNKTKLNLEKYPSLIDLKTTKDKIMLLMFIVKDNNLGEYFTVNDIIFIMSKIFNEKITKDMVSGQFKNKATKMFYDKQNVEGNNKVCEYKLLSIGEKYVKENILNNN